MMFPALFALLVLPALFASSTGDSNGFDFKAGRVRILRNQPGDLHVDSEGVTFRSSDGKYVVTIPIKDLREVDLADPHALRFETYEV